MTAKSQGPIGSPPCPSGPRSDRLSPGGHRWWECILDLGGITTSRGTEIVRLLARERCELEEAVVRATARLESAEGSRECLEAVNAATAAAAAFLAGQITDAAGAVEELGEGWVAEEAQSIAVFCALSADSFEEGVLRAVNHGGDSDSTAAITGNILGAAHGAEAIPEAWLKRLGLRDVVERISVDICRPLDSFEEAEEMSGRYPGLRPGSTGRRATPRSTATPPKHWRTRSTWISHLQLSSRRWSITSLRVRVRRTEPAG